MCNLQISPNMSFRDLLYYWFDVYKKPYLKKYSLRNIEQIIRLHTPEWLKNISIKDITIKNRGILIAKCQDFVNGRKNYIFLHEIISLARDNNFQVLDLFILLSKTRPIKMKNQQHARKYHSYFLVLKK